MSAAGLRLAPLPRRHTAARAPLRPPPMPEVLRLPSGSLVRIMLRGLVWGGVAVRVGLRLLRDRLAGPLPMAQVGRRAREAFELLGGTAIKLGQQLSIRLDILPAEVCAELGRLTDSAPPFPLALAQAEMARAFGRPCEAVLAELEPKPIGAASIACVWRGRLHTGERVAIKVQRPDVERQFTADLGAFDRMSRLLELMSVVRPGFFRNLRAELSAMFLSELDFLAEARAQRLFQRYARRDGLDWVEAPAVFSDLCSRRVLVTAFVEGLPCAELLALAEDPSPEAAAILAEWRIDPRLVGARVLRLAYWGNEDAPFFHGDPHPGNIILLPDSRIVMLDFGAVGVMDGRSVRTLSGVLGSLAKGNPDLATDYTLVRTGPYPHLDLDAFRVDAMKTFRGFFLAIDDPKAPWTERTTAAIWLRFLEAVQKYQIPVNLNTLQSMRCSLLYDSLAARLMPDIGFEVFVQYQRGMAARRMKPLRRRIQAAQEVMAERGSLVAVAAALQTSLTPLERQVSELAASPAVRMVEQVERAWRGLHLILKTLAVGSAVLICGVLASLALQPELESLGQHVLVAMHAPLTQIVLIAVLLLGARHVSQALLAVDGRE